MSNTSPKWHTNEEMHQRFVELLYDLVESALNQYDKGFAIDVETHYERIAAMAVDHRKIIWAPTETGCYNSLGDIASSPVDALKENQ